MIASLLEQNMHLHDVFFTQVRLCAKGILPEANYKSTPFYRPEYGYFAGYNRKIATWNEAPKAIPFLKAQKLEQQAFWHQFTANAFRSSLLLHRDALEKMDAPTLAKEIEWAYPPPKNGKPVASRTAIGPMARHFACYQAQFAGQDTALISAIEGKLGQSRSSPGVCDADAQAHMAKP